MTEAKDPYFRAFFAELRRLGYVEGQNLVVERRSGEGRPARFPELAREVVQLQPDLIFVISGPHGQSIPSGDHNDPDRRDHPRSDLREARGKPGAPRGQPYGLQFRGR